jgi:hypothetical protein
MPRRHGRPDSFVVTPSWRGCLTVVIDFIASSHCSRDINLAVPQDGVESKYSSASARSWACWCRHSLARVRRAPGRRSRMTGARHRTGEPAEPGFLRDHRLARRQIADAARDPRPGDDVALRRADLALGTSNEFLIRSGVAATSIGSTSSQPFSASARSHQSKG